MKASCSFAAAVAERFVASCIERAEAQARAPAMRVLICEQTLCEEGAPDGGVRHMLMDAHAAQESKYKDGPSSTAEGASTKFVPPFLLWVPLWLVAGCVRATAVKDHADPLGGELVELSKPDLVHARQLLSAAAVYHLSPETDAEANAGGEAAMRSAVDFEKETEAMNAAGVVAEEDDSVTEE